MRYAGRDATAKYDEIHAPGIIEETLNADQYKGFLDQADVVELSEAQKQDIKTIENTTGQQPHATPWTKPDLFRLISSHDFEDVASHILTRKAWAFYSSAATDLVTHHENQAFYRRIMFRPRVMRDVTQCNTKRSILGCKTEAPFFVSPAAMARLAHPDGELALARGCASEGLIQCVIHSRSKQASHALIQCF